MLPEVSCVSSYICFWESVSYARQPRVSQEYQDAFQPADFYSDTVSCDRACIIEDNEEALELRLRMIAQAREIIRNYFAMIDQQDYDEALLEEAVAFANVGKQANRIKCATIGWKAMEEMLAESEENADEK